MGICPLDRRAMKNKMAPLEAWRHEEREGWCTLTRWRHHACEGWNDTMPRFVKENEEPTYTLWIWWSSRRKVGECHHSILSMPTNHPRSYKKRDRHHTYDWLLKVMAKDGRWVHEVLHEKAKNKKGGKWRRREQDKKKEMESTKQKRRRESATRSRQVNTERRASNKIVVSCDRLRIMRRFQVHCMPRSRRVHPL